MKHQIHSAGIALMLSVAFTSLSLSSSAQCKGFAKEQITTLSPFIYSGKTNSTVLMPGDRSELTLTFYSGQTYRILMKSTETVGNVVFTIKDAQGNSIFKSNNAQQSDYYDFTSESTQMLTIDMMVEDINYMADATPTSSQCVVVMVGHKE